MYYITQNIFCGLPNFDRSKLAGIIKKKKKCFILYHMKISNILKRNETMLEIKSHKLPQWSVQTFPHGSSEKCG